MALATAAAPALLPTSQASHATLVNALVLTGCMGQQAQCAVDDPTARFVYQDLDGDDCGTYTLEYNAASVSGWSCVSYSKVGLVNMELRVRGPTIDLVGRAIDPRVPGAAAGILTDVDGVAIYAEDGQPYAYAVDWVGAAAGSGFVF